MQGKRHYPIIQPMMKFDEDYMRLALDLAKKGKGTTSPNPMVGAVIVSRDKIAGQGWHHKAGESHAEIIALVEAGRTARDATLYVTLEPCSTTGRTPPCTDAVIKSGIRRAVVGSIDPNPRHSGRGIEILRKAGIEVKINVIEEECRKLNEGFWKYMKTGLPFVTVKAAMSLDGKIASRTGESKWITNELSRTRAHVMRNESDAVIVGIGTVKTDNPRLTVRVEVENVHDPKKIVVDTNAEIGLDTNLLSKEIASSTIIAVSEKTGGKKLDAIKKKGAEVLLCAEKNGRIVLNDLMRKLAGKGIIYVLVEGGATLITGFLDEGLVDKIAFFYAPVIIGGKKAPSVVMGEGAEKIEDALKIENLEIERFGDDILFTGYVKNPRES